MGLRFIFMLTRNDRTVANAADHLATALRLGVRHIGFKDIGLRIDRLKALNETIKAGGATSYLEVVSLDPDSEAASAKAAVEIGVDILLGGTRVDEVLPVVAGTRTQYYPFPGRIVGHPSVLEGTIADIVESAKNLAARDGVHGLDLLAYRSREDVPALMKAVCDAVPKPVIMAGSIATPDRIAIVKEAGAAGFTIGTAALDGEYPADGSSVEQQLAAIVRDVAALNQHLSPFHKRSVAGSFEELDDDRPSETVGRINDMRVRLTKLTGAQTWRFHKDDDRMFIVHKGRMMMKFRDRDETIAESEFIVVPHGVEHCPVAVSGSCEIIVLEPATSAPHARAYANQI